MMPNDTHPVAHAEPSDPFPFGERTLYALRDQTFDVGEDFGTMILPRARFTPVHDVIVVNPENAPRIQLPADPMARLEQKLDAAIRMMETIQKRLDSMDQTLARVVNQF